MVEHALGGGVQRHVRELVSFFFSRANFLVLAPIPGGLLRISHNIPDLPSPLYFDTRRELSALRQFLAECALSRIHYHHMIQLPWDIARLPLDLNLPYDFTAHDYFSFCPQITLTSENFRYCGEPAEAGCNSCLAIRPTSDGESIEAWRSRFRAFVEGAERVFAPTPGVVDRLKKHFPTANLVLAPHPEGPERGTSQDPRWRYEGKGPLKVLVLGALNPTKGPDLLEGVALDAHARGLPLEFHLLGSAYRRLRAQPESSLLVHGRYRDQDLDHLIETLSPHLVWFPAQWPETHSYTLSAAIRHGLPVAAPNFGAFRDRLAGRPLSWLPPWDMKASAWNDLFMRLRSAASDAPGYLLKDTVQPGNFSYEEDYLLKSEHPKPTQVHSGLDLRTHARSWRLSKEFISGYLMSFAHTGLRRIYTLPAVSRIAALLVPEYKVQLFRRWLGRY